MILNKMRHTINPTEMHFHLILVNKFNLIDHKIINIIVRGPIIVVRPRYAICYCLNIRRDIPDPNNTYYDLSNFDLYSFYKWVPENTSLNVSSSATYWRGKHIACGAFVLVWKYSYVFPSVIVKSQESFFSGIMNTNAWGL